MTSDAGFLEPSAHVLSNARTFSSATDTDILPYGLASTLSLQATALDAPDLLAIAFDSSIDHVLLGQTTVNFILQNQGTQDATAFDVDIVLSDDELIGNADDQIIETLNISGLAAGETLSQSVALQLPLDALNASAAAEDSPGQPTDYVSLNRDFLGVVVDAEGAVTESNEANNQNQGKGQDLDDVSYFPWDIDGNGQVTPSDAIFAINRLGQSTDDDNAKADLNGDGSITPTDTIAVINRLGYRINSDVIESATNPVISVGLVSDTGASGTDQVTSEAGLSGAIANFASVTTFQARLEGSSETEFVDITEALGDDGLFTITPAQLSTIFGDTLPDGSQVIILQTLDAVGVVNSEAQLYFQLDTQQPTSSISLSGTRVPDGIIFSFEVTFSEAMDESAFDAASYTLTSGETAVDISSVTQLSPTRVRINLPAALASNPYEFTVSSTLTDIAGNAVSTAMPFSFTVTPSINRITEISPNRGEAMVVSIGRPLFAFLRKLILRL